MAQNFTLSADSRRGKSSLRKLKARLTPAGIDRTVSKVAYITHRRLLQRTPKKWTGQTRRNWRVFRRGSGHYSITNKSKVMVFLEKGTKGHGPKRAKRLFIPLTRKAALAGARQVMRANRQHSLNQTFDADDTARRAPFVIGKDFVLAKRVRGIKALRIVQSHRPFARITLKAAMRLHIRKIIQSI